MRAPQIKMIVGLGNPGDEYANTRHNVGFMTLDALSSLSDVRASSWIMKRGALISEAQIFAPSNALQVGASRVAHSVLLVKPQSFMNCSGGPVSKLASDYELDPEEILVIHDELDLPAGDVRVKVGGGHAGHNGLRSIIDKLQSNAFVRVRIGIGRPVGRMPVADFVLAQIHRNAAEDVQQAVHRATDIAQDIVISGVVHARDTYNVRG